MSVRKDFMNCVGCGSLFESADQSYLESLEKGDLVACQRMVNEAAKKAGYTLGPFYHGTDSKFNEFNPAIIRDWGRSILKVGGIWLSSSQTGVKMFGIYTLSLFVSGKMLKVDARRETEPDVWFGKDIAQIDYIKEKFVNRAKESGLDGVVFKNAMDGSAIGTIVVVHDPTRVKLSAPVTYDNSGEVIPLSDRFDKTKKDLRY